MYALSGFCDQEPILNRKVPCRVLIALPYITEDEWDERGFSRLPSSPPILFKYDLSRHHLFEKIELTGLLLHGQSLDDEQWRALQIVLGGTVVLQKETPGQIENPKTGTLSISLPSAPHLFQIF